MRSFPPHIPSQSPSDASDGQAISAVSRYTCIWSNPWIRLCVHTLLRELQIFPGLEMCDRSQEYTPSGSADIWKGIMGSQCVLR